MLVLDKLEKLRIGIRNLSERVEKLETQVTNTTQNYSGMPKGGSGKNDNREQLIILKDKLKAKKEHLEYLLMIAEYIISDVKDPLIMAMLSYRYIEGKTWMQVAMAVGGNNTEDSCRMMCKRYVEKHAEDFEVIDDFEEDVRNVR